LNANLVSEVRSAFEEAGQGHVFNFWDRLGQEERRHLLKQACQIDLTRLKDASREALGQAGFANDSDADLEPAPWIPLPSGVDATRLWEEAEGIGEELLNAGKIAAFTVAGGQGTRLGFNGPKGAFPITPVSQKSLFQLFAEKIKAAQMRFEKPIMWFIMTSEINDEATKKFFIDNDNFGLSSSRVRFLRQGMMPAICPTGEIILERPDRISMNPDGHGGFFRAVVDNGVAEEMRNAGIETISYFQVDNPLAPFLEPAFLGFHSMSGSEMSSRAAHKKGPDEKVGVFCKRNGNLSVIEYSDLPDNLARLRSEDGNLVFNAGNLAMHAIDLAFVERIGKNKGIYKLPYHSAKKKVPTVDAQGCKVTPKEPNGIKLETFVFDAIPLAKAPCIVEVCRADAFSPIKNADGEDSIATCRSDQLRKYARWVREAGGELPIDETGEPNISFEITPQFADNQDEFTRRWRDISNPCIEDGLILD
jgi:UDP-N-acetylglucosamine/UDP-N-acetylgalactosamine diphosphorylase